MKLAKVLWISIGCLVIGSLYYGLQKRLIIIQLPSYASNSSNQESRKQVKKQLTVYYWAQGSFKHEAITIIDTDNKADMVRYIVTSWLTILEQSCVILSKKVCLETVVLTSSHDAYISFEHTIFTKNEPTYDKWMRVESLLKTIRSADMGINRVNLFVHHQPMADVHLDFSKGWPIHGFLEC